MGCGFIYVASPGISVLEGERGWKKEVAPGMGTPGRAGVLGREGKTGKNPEKWEFGLDATVISCPSDTEWSVWCWFG